MPEPGTNEYARQLIRYAASIAEVLTRLRELASQGAGAEHEPVREAAGALAVGVCERWSGVCAAPPGPRPSRLSPGVALYKQAYDAYQALCELTCGYPDDVLHGILEPDDVVARWPECAAKLLEPGLLFAPGEGERLAAEAAVELANVQPKPLPTVYRAPGAPEDRWSETAAERQRERLAAYREGDPFARRPGRPWNVSDVLLVVPGEAPDRFVTKLGGLPYRPASAPWPRTPAGDPMVFFGQVCFADSLDLVGPLPGDVLLIFTHGEHDHTSGGDLHYEWYPLGLDELVPADQVPATPWRVFPVYTKLSRQERDAGADERPEWVEWAKIGGSGYWIQYEPRAPGRFLAAFDSVAWCGDPDPNDPRERHLDFFDGGLLNIGLRPDGSVVEVFQCY